MSRDGQLAVKRQEIQKELEQWAHEVGLLGCGEQIVLSLRIGEIPLVEVEKGEATISDLPIRELFSDELCLRAGVERPGALLSVILRTAYHLEISTVREFLWVGPQKVLQQRNVGEKTMRKIEAVLQAAGLSWLES